MEFFDELLSHFLKKHGGEDLTTTSEVMTMLKNYPYPGNIRELEQIVEFLIIEKKNSGSKKVKLEDLPEKVREDKNNSPKTLPDKIETYTGFSWISQNNKIVLILFFVISFVMVYGYFI